ncbi:hypothetical protein BGZ63DRAFT_320180, partial [Mariannaea sp. PMI_226]
MNANDSANDWLSEEETRSRLSGHSSPDCDDPEHLLTQRSQLRPARRTLSFVPYTDWTPDEPYDTQCIHYDLEWKVTFKSRKVGEQTEEDIVISPCDFWNKILSPRIDDIAKTTSKHSVASATTIVMTISQRSERNITKHFPKSEIDWQVIVKQLQAWSHLLRVGKKAVIYLTFKLVDAGNSARTGQGVTARRLAERDACIDVEQMDSPDAFRQVYRLMRCPGAPCDRQPHCWHDSKNNKRYKLLGHHLRSLVKHVQNGGKLDTHDDVPDAIRQQLFAEEQQLSDRKRKRRD